MNSARFGRLVEQETLDGTRAYSPVEFLASVRKGVWKELDAPAVKIDAYRRGLQRSYLTLVNGKMNPRRKRRPPGRQPGGFVTAVTGAGDEKPMYRAELRTLKASIAAAIAKATDHETKAHLEAAGRDRPDSRSEVPAAGYSGYGRVRGARRGSVEAKRATDGHGFTRIRNKKFLSVCIRVHPWPNDFLWFPSGSKFVGLSHSSNACFRSGHSVSSIENQAVSRFFSFTIMCWRKIPSNVKPRRSAARRDGAF